MNQASSYMKLEWYSYLYNVSILKYSGDYERPSSKSSSSSDIWHFWWSSSIISGMNEKSLSSYGWP